MIRRARAEDLDAIEAALPAVVAAMRAGGNDQWGPDYPTRAHFAADLAEGTLVVDDDGGRIRGFAVLNREEPPEYEALDWRVGRPALVIHRLAVEPAFRRQGVADGLFAWAEAEAGRRGWAGLRSDTSDANEGMNALFRRRGWRRVGTLRFGHAVVGFVAWEKALP